MPTQITDVIEEAKKGKRNFRGMKLGSADFSGMDLRNADFRNCSLPYAKFVGSDLRYSTFEGSNCYGVDWTGANLHRVNFKDCNLSYSKMLANDLFGITLTLECKSFEGIQLDPGWWYGFLFYGLLMQPPTEEARDKLIELLGVERYKILRQQYARRLM